MCLLGKKLFYQGFFLSISINEMTQIDLEEDKDMLRNTQLSTINATVVFCFIFITYKNIIARVDSAVYFDLSMIFV